MKNYIKIANKVIPLWFIFVLLFSGIGLGVLTHYVMQTVVIPFEVKEPLEILEYTLELSLFPGEIKEINATVHNYAPINYSVQFDFHLGDSTYQQQFVVFSDEVYNVTTGEQTLTAWVSVSPSAPPITTALTIHFKRIDPSLPPPPDTGQVVTFSFEDNFDSYIVGTFPTEGVWDLLYPGAGIEYQIIVDSVSVSPHNSLQLMGRGTAEGSHMGAVAAFPLEWSNRNMSFTVYVMVDEISDTAACFGFAKRVSDGARYPAHIRFLKNGSIWSQGTVLQSYEPDTWYKITLVLDTTTDTYDVWVNDEIKGSGIETGIYQSTEIDLFVLASNLDWTRVYYDNVEVTGYSEN